MLKLVFHAPYIPTDLETELSSEANRRLQQIFGNSAALEAAYHQNKKMPQPHDSLSMAINDILYEAQRKVTIECGPSAARYLSTYFTKE